MRAVAVTRHLLALVVGVALGAGVAAGTASANVAASPGTVYQWGFNSGLPHLVPTKVSGLPSQIVAVQGGNWGGMALDSAGNVWDWGSNKFGELGNGRTRKSPNSAVRAVGPTHVVSIGEGNNFAAAVDSSGNLWVWGWNKYRQLCLPHVRYLSTPETVPGVDALAVSGGGGHLLILLADGTVDACGVNNVGQLGNGTFRNSATPVPVANLTDVVQVSAGNMFSAALEANGSVWTWGYDRFGQLGIGQTTNENSPHKVDLPAASEIYVGGDYPDDGHMMAKLTDGRIMAWGDNTDGQLGTGNTVNSSVPEQVDVPDGVHFTYVAAGGADSFAIDSTGGLWSWGGLVGAGDLGNGTKDGAVRTPQQIGTGFSLLSATANEGVAYSTP